MATNRIILAPKNILREAIKLKRQNKFSEALQLLFNNCVEFDFNRENISIASTSKFEQLEQPNKIKNIKPRFPERIFRGHNHANL